MAESETRTEERGKRVKPRLSPFTAIKPFTWECYGLGLYAFATSPELAYLTWLELHNELGAGELLNRENYYGGS